MWKQGLNILLYIILKSLPLSKPSLCYCWMLPWSLVVEEAKGKEQAAKWSLNIKLNLLHTVDGGHAGLPNWVLLYQHLYVWEILSLVKTGEKKEWLSFSPPAVFYCKYPDFQNIFFFSKFFKLCGSNWKERHLFLDRLTWLVEILQIYCITEAELWRESLPNCNQAGTINCFETISLLFPLLFFLSDALMN